MQNSTAIIIIVAVIVIILLFAMSQQQNSPVRSPFMPQTEYFNDDLLQDQSVTFDQFRTNYYKIVNLLNNQEYNKWPLPDSQTNIIVTENQLEALINSLNNKLQQRNYTSWPTLVTPLPAEPPIPIFADVSIPNSTPITQDSAETGNLWVDEHNKLRNEVNTSTGSDKANPPLRMLTWNPQLAQSAKAYAEKCNFNHACQDPQYENTPYCEQNRGENLYWSQSSRYKPANPAEVVQDWGSEKQQYRYPGGFSSNTGHYTQIVNRNVSQIGCECARCPSPTGNENLCVCRYDTIQGSGKPY